MVCSALAQLEERAPGSPAEDPLILTPGTQPPSDGPNPTEIKAPDPCAADEHDA